MQGVQRVMLSGRRLKYQFDLRRNLTTISGERRFTRPRRYGSMVSRFAGSGWELVG